MKEITSILYKTIFPAIICAAPPVAQIPHLHSMPTSSANTCGTVAHLHCDPGRSRSKVKFPSF